MDERSSYTLVFREAYSGLGPIVWLLLFGMICASVLEGIGLTMLMPLLTKIGMDNKEQVEQNFVIENINSFLAFMNISNEVGPLMTLVVSILLLQVFVTYIVKKLEVDCMTSYTAYWRNRLFNAVINTDWAFLMNSSSEVEANQIFNESSRVSATFNSFLQMVNSIFFIFVYSVIALITAWQVVIALLVFGICIFFLTKQI